MGATRAACDMAVTAAASGIVAGNTVHLSFGDVPAEEYAYQLAADHIIHGWDLAVATGGDTSMDPDLVEALAAWFAGNEDAYRRAGAIAERPAGDGRPATPGASCCGPSGATRAGVRASRDPHQLLLDRSAPEHAHRHDVITAANAATTARLSAAMAVAFDMPQMSWRPDELPPSSP